MKLHEWNARLHGLVIFRSLLSDPVAARFAALIDCLTAGNNSVGSVCNAVAQFESVLFERTTNWGTHLSTTVLETETVCVRQAAAGTLPPVLQTALDNELAFLQQLNREGSTVILITHDNGIAATARRIVRVSDGKMATIGEYEEAYRLYDNLLEGSDFSYAPWHLINGEDKRRANLKITETLVDALDKALHAKEDPAALAAAAKAQANSAGAAEEIPLEGRSPEQQLAVAQAAAEQAAAQAAHAPRASRFRIVDRVPSLDEVDHGLVLDHEGYKDRLKKQQKRLNKLEMEMYQARVPLVLMFEGWDAAGKGGAIKRVAQALDARAYTIFPSPAPTKPELAHPFLWRYWTRLPKAGHVGIYDRSWYGRVLVERVEGFATDAQWARAYDEINEFEQELVRWGAVLLKFWVDVSQEEQLARFRARQEDPAKQWKITDEDWRNRDKYPQYKAAIEDMFRLTSTPFAPWMVLESDDKGRLNLSRRDALIEVEGLVPENTISDSPRRPERRDGGHFRRRDDRPRASNGFIANTNKKPNK